MGLASIEGARIGPASTELSSTRPVAAEPASVEPASTESSSTKLGALPLASIEAASPEASRAEPAQSEPPPSLSTAPVPASFDTVESLAAAITDRLIAHKQYPAAALKRKSEGTVRIALQVAPDGTLASLAIQSRSGSAILDEAALQLVRSIFPLHIRLEAAVSLLIPVEYRIPK
jgi:protein TonB